MLPFIRRCATPFSSRQRACRRADAAFFIFHIYAFERRFMPCRYASMPLLLPQLRQSPAHEFRYALFSRHAAFAAAAICR